jgi:hypothetical protein
MAMTIKAGIRTLGSYVYCGGVNETARRKRQIDARNLRPVWGGPRKVKRTRSLRARSTSVVEQE